jgi:GMP synthase-like glutamine amidotransferase
VKRLGILEADILDADLAADFGSYGQMFARWFDRLGGGLAYRYYQVQAGELPRHLDECDAYLITGSRAGVYDDLDWLPPLRTWLRGFHTGGARLIGICFGHQLIADALGGRAERSTRGWGVGVRAERVHAAHWPTRFGAPPPATLRLLYSHQDQVTRPPPGAVTFAGSDFCPHAALAIGATLVGFQGHPEFTRDYLRRLLARRREQLGETRYSAALASLAQATDEDVVGRWLLGFIGAGTGPG